MTIVSICFFFLATTSDNGSKRQELWKAVVKCDRLSQKVQIEHSAVVDFQLKKCYENSYEGIKLMKS